MKVPLDYETPSPGAESNLSRAFKQANSLSAFAGGGVLFLLGLAMQVEEHRDPYSLFFGFVFEVIALIIVAIFPRWMRR